MLLLIVAFIVQALMPVCANKPNIFMILADDYGWANAGWHNNATTAGKREVQTPNMEALIREGIELNQHYVFKFCSPTRSAIQSGRNPIHVNVQNVNPTYHNPENPVSGFSAIARNMTGMAEHMRDAGYSTGMVGKWDAGMATADHTPKGRGYEQSLIYFHHANDYWTYGVGGHCSKLAHRLRNETDQGWGEGENEFQGFHFPSVAAEETVVDSCPSNFTILKRTGVCHFAAAGRSKKVQNISECCSWCASTPFVNGSCVGWTFHADDNTCFNCFKTQVASGAKNSDRTSGCLGSACNSQEGPIIDLWETEGPAHDKKKAGSPQQCHAQNNTDPWPAAGGECKYEDELFEEEVQRILQSHNASDPDRPLFLFWAPHIVHGPAQVPQDAFELMDFIADSDPNRRHTLARQIYLARVRYIDAAIGRLVATIKAKGMWENSLLVFTSDNGGPLGSANNYPLKGGKHSNWQGGVRVNAWVSGGLVPASQRGTKLDSIICGWDWYATFAHLAGADPTDHKAAKANLPPIDAVNQWPAIAGLAATPASSPRTHVPLGSCTDADEGRDVFCQSHGHQQTTVNGIVAYLNASDIARAMGTQNPAVDSSSPAHLWKLLVGHNIPLAGWTGPKYPNGTGQPHRIEDCGVPPHGTGCLFDVTADPTEHHNLMSNDPTPYHKTVHDMLLNMIHAHNATTFTPDRGVVDEAGVCAAVKSYGGFWGPWLK